MNIQPADRLRLLGDMLQVQNDMLGKMLQFGEIDITDNVGLETGSWRGRCLASV